MNGKERKVIRSFDEFVDAAGFLPDNKREIVFDIRDPLEMYFMDVADKHGIIDEILDIDFDTFEQ